MKKFRITWDWGLGENEKVIYANSLDGAILEAYYHAKEEFEFNVSYNAEEIDENEETDEE